MSQCTKNRPHFERAPVDQAPVQLDCHYFTGLPSAYPKGLSRRWPACFSRQYISLLQVYQSQKLLRS